MTWLPGDVVVYRSQLAAAVELGLRTAEEAAAYRAEGERVLRDRALRRLGRGVESSP